MPPSLGAGYTSCAAAATRRQRGQRRSNSSASATHAVEPAPPSHTTALVWWPLTVAQGAWTARGWWNRPQAFYGPSTGCSGRVVGAWLVEPATGQLRAFYGPSTGRSGRVAGQSHRRATTAASIRSVPTATTAAAYSSQPGQDHGSQPGRSPSYLRQCGHPWAGYRDVPVVVGRGGQGGHAAG